MSAVESRFLGPISVDGTADRGVIDGVVSFGGSSLPVRVEIAHPARFGDAVVLDVDMVLGNLGFVDGLARDTIAAGLRLETSAPARLSRVWWERRLGRPRSEAEFLDHLKPSRIAVLPDGGKANRDRVLMTYGISDGSVTGTITVRFVEPSGPVLDPAPPGGFS